MARLFLLTRKKPVTIYRYGQGSYINGRYVMPEPEEVSIMANLQPAKWNEVQQMPESDRTNKWCKVFSKSPMRTKKEGDDGYNADRFYWQDDLYEVRKTKCWDMGILDHYEVMAVRVELTPEETLL
jgi:hypothetical protein